AGLLNNIANITVGTNEDSNAQVTQPPLHDNLAVPLDPATEIDQNNFVVWLTNPSHVLPNFDVDLNNIDLQPIINAADKVLGVVENGLNGQVLGIKLPLVGDGLKNAANFIHDIRTGIIQKLENLGPQQVADQVRNALFEALGPGGALGSAGIVGDTDGN